MLSALTPCSYLSAGGGADDCRAGDDGDEDDDCD